MAMTLDTLVVEFLFKGDKRGLNKFERDFATFQARVQRGLDGLTRSFASIGAGLSVALTGITKAGLTHEQAVNDLRVLNKLTEEQIDLLEKQAQQEGATGRFDSAGVLAAQRELVQRGWDVHEVMRELPHIIDFATAAELNLADAARQAVGQLGQMNRGAEGTADAVNFMGKVFQNGGPEMRNFSRLTQNFRENARQLGFEMESVTAATIHLGREAGGGERGFRSAASDMEMLLKELLDLSEEGQAILEGLAIDPKDIGATGLPEFLRRVALLTNEQLQEVFGSEYWSKVRELTSDSDIRDIEGLHRNLTTSLEGTMKTMAEMKNLGAPGAWEDLKSVINAVNVALGKSGVLSALEWAFDALAALLERVRTAPSLVKTFISAVVLTGPVLLGAAAGLRTLSWLLGERLTAAILFKANRAFRIFRVMLLRQVIPALTAFKITSWAAFAPMLVLGGKVVLIAAAIAAAGALIYKYWEPLKAFFQGFMIGMGEALASLGDAFAEGLKPLAPVWAVLGSMFSQLGDSIRTALDWLKEFLTPVEESAEGFAAAANAGIRLGQVLGFVLLLPLRMLSVLLRVVTTFLSMLGQLFRWIAEHSPVEAFMMAWEGIVDFVRNLFGDVYDTVVAGIEKVASFLSNNPVVAGITWLGEQLGLDADTRKGLAAFGTPAGAGGVPALDSGGIVSRPTLAALAMNSRPEAILPLDQLGGFLRDLGEMTAQAMAPPLIGPVRAPALASAAAGPVTVTKHYSFHWDALNVSVEHGDPDEIAATVGRALEQQLHNVVEDFDDDVER